MATPPINEQDFLKALGKISGKKQTQTTTGGLGKSPLQNYFETKNVEAANAAQKVGVAGKILKPVFATKCSTIALKILHMYKHLQRKYRHVLL